MEVQVPVKSPAIRTSVWDARGFSTALTLCDLTREHPELSEGLCVEMMTRQLADAGAHNLQHQILTALTPWMENLIFRPRWEGELILSKFLEAASNLKQLAPSRHQAKRLQI